jgi:hypothetical protein
MMAALVYFVIKRSECDEEVRRPGRGGFIYAAAPTKAYRHIGVSFEGSPTTWHGVVMIFCWWNPSSAQL